MHVHIFNTRAWKNIVESPFFIILFSIRLANMTLTGEPSLQNTLELAARVLKPLPGHASREILILCGSLTTCDPGDINTTIQVS